MRTAVIALGSNLGDRIGYLQGAVDHLGAAAGITILAVSSVVETDPVGGPEQPDYANAVLIAETILEPLALLDECQAAEQAANRVREVRWGPRTLDVDVIALYEDGSEISIDDPRLAVPHPRAKERGFVLIPWAQIQPDAVLAGQPVVGLLAGVADQGVRQADLILELP